MFAAITANGTLTIQCETELEEYAMAAWWTDYMQQQAPPRRRKIRDNRDTFVPPSCFRWLRVTDVEAIARDGSLRNDPA